LLEQIVDGRRELRVSGAIEDLAQSAGKGAPVGLDLVSRGGAETCSLERILASRKGAEDIKGQRVEFVFLHSVPFRFFCCRVSIANTISSRMEKELRPNNWLRC